MSLIFLLTIHIISIFNVFVISIIIIFTFLHITIEETSSSLLSRSSLSFQYDYHYHHHHYQPYSTLLSFPCPCHPFNIHSCLPTRKKIISRPPRDFNARLRNLKELRAPPGNAHTLGLSRIPFRFGSDKNPVISKRKRDFYMEIY